MLYPLNKKQRRYVIERSNDFSKRHNLKTLEKEDLRDRTPSLTAQLPHHHPLLRKGNVQSKYLVFCEKSLTLNVFILTRVRPLLCVPRVIKINNSDQVRSNLSLKLGHLTQENLTEWRKEISSYPMGMKNGHIERKLHILLQKNYNNMYKRVHRIPALSLFVIC